jgi:hypothetical protein
MHVPDHAQDLLLLAGKDFSALRGMLGNPLFADEIFGFHAQQAIEKSLKAWLAARSGEHPVDGQCRFYSTDRQGEQGKQAVDADPDGADPLSVSRRR